MAFIVETGVGIAGANSYNSVAQADAFFSERGLPAWAALDTPSKERALIVAAAALEVKYRGKWYGQKATAVQRMAWPRAQTYLGVTPLTDPDGAPVPVNAVPEPVREAQLEVVAIQLQGGNFNALPVTRDSLIKRKKIDVLETEWADGAPANPVYPLIDQILFGYALGSLNSAPVMSFTLGLSEEERTQRDAGADSVYDDPRYFLQG